MSIKTLLVDDENSLLEQAKIFLERGNEIKVSTVSSAKKALELLNEEDFDVIVSDYQMPDIDGLKFLEEMREGRNSDIPFIIFTGKGREEVAIKALNLGANRYIQKGGDPKSQYDMLIDAIKKNYVHSKAEEKIVELNSLLRAIRNVNQLISQENDLKSLMKKSSKVLLEARGYIDVSIALLNGENEKIKPFAQSGAHKKRDWEITPYGEGNAPQCVKNLVEKRSIVHVTKLHDYCYGCSYFEKDKAHQTFLVPLEQDEDLLGILSICQTPKHIVSEEERDLLIEVANDLSFAFSKLKTEEMLKESEERFHTLASSVPAVIYLCRNDERWTMLFINEAVEEITGYSRKKFLQDEVSFTELYHPEDKEDIFKKVEMAIECKSTFHLEYRITDAEGNIRWLEEFGKAIYENGEARCLVGSVHDITGKQKVEEELQRSEQRLDLALKGSELGVWDWNVKTDEVKFNERWAEMLGYSIDEIEPEIDSWEERVHPDDLFDVKEELEKHLQGDTDLYKTEHRMRTKSGDWIWVKDIGKVFERDEDGKPVRAIGIHEDITERKEMEEKLKRSEKKFRNIFEDLGDPVMIKKLGGEDDGRILDANKAMFDILGYSPDELIGMNIYDEIVISDPKELSWQEVKEQLREGKRVEFTVKKKRKDGYKIWVEVVAVPMEYEGDDVVLAVNRDITEQKQAETALEESKNKIERLHEISAELQNRYSTDEVFSLAIKAAEDILDFYVCEINVPEDDKMKGVVRSLDFPEEASSDLNHLPIDDSVAGRTYLENRSFLVKDIKKHEVSNPTLEKFRSGISVPIGNHGVFQAFSTEVNHFDEEDLRMAELLMNHVSEALDRIQVKEREEFLHSLLRHDVGNKNQVIKGYLKLMKNCELSEELEKLVNKAEDAAKNSAEIIEKVRKLREIEKKREIKEVDLNLVMKKVLSEHRNQLEEKGIDIDINRCDSTVKGGTLLEELFSNLIENSIQHSKCDVIRIDFQTKENECTVRIEDNGIGINDETKEKIFEKGFKSRDSSGTGLGLYMAKEIAESYGGSVEVKDSEFGGVKFKVRLKKS